MGRGEGKGICRRLPGTIFSSSISGRQKHALLLIFNIPALHYILASTFVACAQYMYPRYSISTTAAQPLIHSVCIRTHKYDHC
jgi:hypothetical protein